MAATEKAMFSAPLPETRARPQADMFRAQVTMAIKDPFALHPLVEQQAEPL
jgi:hypothetical protein